MMLLFTVCLPELNYEDSCDGDTIRAGFKSHESEQDIPEASQPLCWSFHFAQGRRREEIGSDDG